MSLTKLNYFLVIILTFAEANALAQGSADILYFKPEAITEELIDRDVKPDLKSGEYGNRFVNDTVVLQVNHKSVQVIEYRKRGVDYWHYNDQYLESKDKINGSFLRINDCVLKEIQGDSILFTFTITEHTTTGESNARQEDIWLRREQLEGVMVKKF
jgi:hypothetical protein